MSGTEDQYLAGIVEAARWAGWLVHHCRPARRADGGWSTPIQGTPGFPDLILAHPRARRLLCVELKRPGRALTSEQSDWFAALAAAGALPRKLVVPDEYEAFLDELRALPWAPKGVEGSPPPEHQAVLDEVRIACQRARELAARAAQVADELPEDRPA